MSCFQLFCFRFPLRNSQAAAERDQLLRCDAVKPAVTSLSHWLRNPLNDPPGFLLISSGFQKLQQNQLQSCDAVAPFAAQASASTGFPVSAAAARQFTAPTSFLVKFLSIFLFLQQQLFGLTSGLCRDIKSTANMCSAHIFG